MSFGVIALSVLLVLAMTLWRQDPDELELSLSLPFSLGLFINPKRRRRGEE